MKEKDDNFMIIQNMKLIVKSIIQAFQRLPFWMKVLVLTVGIAGSYVRYNNLFNFGFYGDTVFTQYEWAKHGFDLGYYRFWTEYNDFYDYLSGSLLFLISIEGISRLVWGTSSPEHFVIILKIFHWICDLVLLCCGVYIARRYGKYSAKQLFLFALFLYVVPSLWFISSVWGQIDSYVAAMSVVSVLFLFRREEENMNGKVDVKKFYYDQAFWAGIIYIAGFWVKMQAMLIIPILVLYFFSLGNKYAVRRFISGILLLTVLINIVPLVANPLRLATLISTPFARNDNISIWASTFWELVGMRGMGSDKLFEYGFFNITVSQAGIVIVLTLMTILYVHIMKISRDTLKKIWVPDIKTIRSLLIPKKITFQLFIMLSALLCSFYFMFLTKMHSRYLHMGIVYCLMLLATLKLDKQYWKWFLSIILLNLSYFINQLFVFAAYNTEPVWPKLITKGLYINAASFLNIVALQFIYLLVWSAQDENRNQGKDKQN